MKGEIWRGQNSIKFLYYRYKDSPYYSLVVLFVVVLVCFVLVFNMILPQIYNWFSVRDEVVATQDKLSTLRRNLNFISFQVNKTTLEENRQIALRALPVDSNFGDIVNAIAIAAVKSGVSVDDFSFSPGQVPSTSGALGKSSSDFSTVRVTLSLAGGVSEVGKFMAEINEKLPVNNVERVEIKNGRSILSIVFFSKPYKASVFKGDEPIEVVSAENGSLLNTLSEWNSSMNGFYPGINQNQLPQASSGAVPLF